MTYTPDSFELDALSLPITQAALQTADRFARQQPTVAKAEQVRLNTLAVWVVNDYLQLMGIATNLTASDSWNPVMRLTANTADLEIAGAGRLECRPWVNLPHAACAVPPEVWHDRIGYVVVQINETDRQSTLLGFVETATTEELAFSDLHPPEALLDHLDRLLHPVVVAQPAVTQTTAAATNLGQWLQNVMDASWQTVDALLGASDLPLAYGFRGDAEGDPATGASICRAKRINFSIQTIAQPLILIVELSSESNGLTQIRLQVHPTAAIYLPSGLQLTVLDETGAVFLSAQSRDTDNYIQLELSGDSGEAFSVCVELDTDRITEHFVI